jgi:hypothetical protein
MSTQSSTFASAFMFGQASEARKAECKSFSPMLKSKPTLKSKPRPAKVESIDCSPAQAILRQVKDYYLLVAFMSQIKEILVQYNDALCRTISATCSDRSSTVMPLLHERCVNSHCSDALSVFYKHGSIHYWTCQEIRQTYYNASVPDIWHSTLSRKIRGKFLGFDCEAELRAVTTAVHVRPECIGKNVGTYVTTLPNVYPVVFSSMHSVCMHGLEITFCLPDCPAITCRVSAFDPNTFTFCLQEKNVRCVYTMSNGYDSPSASYCIEIGKYKETWEHSNATFETSVEHPQEGLDLSLRGKFLDFMATLRTRTTEW